MIFVVIVKYLNVQGYDAKQGWVDFIGNKEIFYICISLAVAALFELLARPKRGMHNVTLIQGILLLIDVVLAGFIYTYLTVQYDVYNVDYGSKLVVISLAILVYTLIFGTVSFIERKRG